MKFSVEREQLSLININNSLLIDLDEQGQMQLKFASIGRPDPDATLSRRHSPCSRKKQTFYPSPVISESDC